MAQLQQKTEPHFLLVSIAAQGHINPSRRLARSLAKTTGAHVTVSTSIIAHRLMFPSSAAASPNKEEKEDDEQVEEGGLISYVPYSDGLEYGSFDLNSGFSNFVVRVKESLARLAADLAGRGRPVTCIINTLFMTMAIEVAKDLGIPSVLFWIQPASVFSIYHHYFNRGFDAIVSPHVNDPLFTVDVPGLQQLQIKDLPSYITTHNSEDSTYGPFFTLFKQVFRIINQHVSAGNKPRILVNSFLELEASVLPTVDDVELITVGPVVPSGLISLEEGLTSKKAAADGDLFENDSKGYMDWLESKEKKSVVYVSFGSLTGMSKRQVEELFKGLEECGRPYLWVVRKDVKEKDGGIEVEKITKGDEFGMVVEWCDQVRVLSHPAVGCFVTHCGWNSVSESIVCGVPMVMLPKWVEQSTNARLIEYEWGVGVKAEENAEEITEAKELRRCLDLVMGDEEISRRALMWKNKAREAVSEGGSSVRNLRAFVQQVREQEKAFVSDKTLMANPVDTPTRFESELSICK